MCIVTNYPVQYLDCYERSDAVHLAVGYHVSVDDYVASGRLVSMSTFINLVGKSMPQWALI